MGDELHDERDGGDAARMGARLRSLRRQKHMSLQDVEAVSRGEFKASVLGAYERGERAMSVPRLQRLARVYRVPIDQMVPTGGEPYVRSPNGDDPVIDVTNHTDRPQAGGRSVTIDLTVLDQVGGQEGELLSRYVRMIEVQRGDYNGRMLTLRRDDMLTLACIFGCESHQVPARLEGLGLLLASR